MAKPLAIQVPGFELKLMVSDDQMQLHLSGMRTEAEQIITPEILLEQLTKQKITALPAEDILNIICEKLLAGNELTEEFLSQGIYPTSPKHGKLILLVKPYKGILKREASEFVDVRFTKHFDNILIGNVVARIYAAQAGEAGQNIFGKAVKAQEAQKVQIDADASIERVAQEHGLFEEVRAKAAGYLEYSGKSLKIKSKLTLEEVNFQTGDIDFVGAVEIKGSVKTGFSVVAEQDIEVNDTFSGNLLESKTGKIVIRGAVLGPETRTVSAQHVSSAMVDSLGETGSAIIIAASDIEAKLVSRAVLTSKANIKLEREIRHSTLSADGQVEAAEAVFIGGKLQAVGGANLKSVGSKAGTKTTIDLCCDIQQAADFRKLELRVSQLSRARELTRLYLGPYAHQPPVTVANLNSRLSERLELFFTQLIAIETELTLSNQRLDELMTENRACIPARITINENIYSGTEILAGHHRKFISEDMPGPHVIEFDPDFHEINIKQANQADKSEVK